jgi:hypothetical protein
VIETPEINRVKVRLGVPQALAACHTGEVAGYVIEGHVPAIAIKRLLSEKPQAKGLAVQSDLQEWRSTALSRKSNWRSIRLPAMTWQIDSFFIASSGNPEPGAKTPGAGAACVTVPAHDYSCASSSFQ